jgi:hypothetical protein
MGLRAKHIVIGLGVLGLGVLYVKDRVKKLSVLMTKLIPIPTGFRNLRIENWVLKCNIDVTLHNPTTEAFNPNGIIVTVKRLDIRDNAGTLIGKVNINRNSVDIPAGGKYTLKDLLVEIDAKGNIFNLANLVKIKSIADIKADVVIGILGTEYVIPQL